MTCVFLVLVLTPIALIPIFPEFFLMRVLFTSQAAVLGLIISAVIMSVVIDKALYGKGNEDRGTSDHSIRFR